MKSLDSIPDATPKLPTLFISYNTNDGDFYARELEKQFTGVFEVLRDDSSLLVNEDFYEFMRGIASCDNAVIVLTANYLKSQNCMLEMSYLFGQEDWDEKAMVLVIDDSLYSVERKLEVLNYWHDRQQQCAERLEKETLGRDILLEDKDYVDQICGALEPFLAGVSQRKNPSQIAIVSETIRKSQSAGRHSIKKIIENNQRKIASIIEKNPDISLEELAKAADLSIPAIRQHLHRLRQR